VGQGKDPARNACSPHPGQEGGGGPGLPRTSGGRGRLSARAGREPCRDGWSRRRERGAAALRGFSLTGKLSARRRVAVKVVTVVPVAAGAGLVPEPADEVAEEARGRDGDGEEEAGLGDGAAEGRLGERGGGRRLQQAPGPQLGRREDHAAAEETQAGGRRAAAAPPRGGGLRLARAPPPSEMYRSIFLDSTRPGGGGGGGGGRAERTAAERAPAPRVIVGSRAAGGCPGPGPAPGGRLLPSLLK